MLTAACLTIAHFRTDELIKIASTTETISTYLRLIPMTSGLSSKNPSHSEQARNDRNNNQQFN